MSNLNRRSFISLALGALLAGGLIAGCNSGGGTDTANKGPEASSSAEGNKAGDTIKVGLVASLNGDLRPWGLDSDKGVKVAVDEINKAGGINGKQIELMVEDSNSSPEQGKSATEKLISRGAVVVLGEVASGITAQMANACTEKGVPIVAIGATRDDITDIGPNVFRVCYQDRLQGPVMAKFAFDELGLRNVALMTDKKQPYSTGLSGSFRAYFEKMGGKIIDEQFYESGQTQFNAQLTNLKAKNPDGVFLSGYFNEVGPIVKQADQVGLKNVKYMGGDGWDSKEILATGGKAIEGSFFCNHYNDKEDRPEVKSFLEKFQAMHGGLPGTTMGALAFDAAAVVGDALKRCPAGDVSSKTLAAALHETDGFRGVSGDITFKGHGGNPPKRALVVELTKDGQVFRKAYEVTDFPDL